MNKHDYLPDIEMYRIVINGKRYFVNVSEFVFKDDTPHDLALWYCPVLTGNYGHYFTVLYASPYNGHLYQCIELSRGGIKIFFSILRYFHNMKKHNEVGQLLYHMAWRYFGRVRDEKKAYRTTVTIEL